MIAGIRFGALYPKRHCTFAMRKINMMFVLGARRFRLQAGISSDVSYLVHRAGGGYALDHHRHLIPTVASLVKSPCCPDARSRRPAHHAVASPLRQTPARVPR